MGSKIMMILAMMILHSFPCIAPKPSPPQYRGFKLNIIWPPSICETDEWECAQKPEKFVVSWLRPLMKAKYYGNQWLQNKTIYNRRKKLQEFWPDLKAEKNKLNVSFYKKQYNKYGRQCSSKFTPEGYVSLVLRLGELHIKQISDALKGITPNANVPHKLSKIVKAIEESEAFKDIRVLIICSKTSDKYYLVGFDICLTDDGEELINCGKETLHFCSNDESIFFPSSM